MTHTSDEELAYSFHAPVDAPFSVARYAQPKDLATLLRQQLAAQLQQVRAHAMSKLLSMCRCMHLAHAVCSLIKAASVCMRCTLQMQWQQCRHPAASALNILAGLHITM